MERAGQAERLVEDVRELVAAYGLLTKNALVAVLATDSLLGLELRLDDIERTGRDAGDEAASRASYTGLCRFCGRSRGERSLRMEPEW